jgi:UDP-3-O-acyl N-acetylglucosamine deacetylase
MEEVQQTTRFQMTIRKEVSFQGIGLHTGKSCEVTIKPSVPGKGIRFRRKNLPDTPEIPAHINCVVDTTRCTVLGHRGVKIMTVEHLLSALAGLAIDNALIEVEGEEIPALDGSSAEFCKGIMAAGLVELDQPRQCLVLNKPVSVRDGSGILIALPSNEYELSVTLVRDHQYSALTDQFIGWKASTPSYLSEIAPARTFGFLAEAKMLLAKGLIRGVDRTNAVIFDDDNTLTPPRFINEPVRHKVLDLIGDLSLLGPLQAHIIGIRTSHQINHLLCRSIQSAAMEGEV